MTIVGQMRRFDRPPLTSGLTLETDIQLIQGHVLNVPNPESKYARRCALRRRTSGNCEVFHIVCLLPEYNVSDLFS